ncbi:MAG: response regulator [Scytolyngbya sp. HA4215-MV1]|nr:response regulator [Scytolyngbya sp. HA4215-MV1]
MKTILVIEDESMIRDSLQDLLEMEGFRAIAAEDGIVGIQLAEAHLPDLILCDVNMPGIDGYGVLQALHDNPSTQSIPLIFLTAMGAKSNIRQGMTLGADDYLVKPCTRDELIGAIEGRLKKQTMIQSESQKKLDNLRSSITLALPHELRTPLNGILSFSELLMTDYDVLERTEVLEVAECIHTSASRLYHLIQNFLLYTELELTVRDPNRLKAIQTYEVSKPKLVIATIATNIARQNGRESDLHLNLVDSELLLSEIKLKKVLEELISNAFKFSAIGSPVEITSQVDGSDFTITLTDYGRGMTAEHIAYLGAYMQFDRKIYEQQGAGLGLIIAKRLLELHGGSLTIASTPSKTTVVKATLPLASAAKRLDLLEADRRE